MAALNLSSNGPSITASYQKIVNAGPPSGAAASSPTYGQWAIFTVQAPLVNAFQQDSGKESVLKVQTTGEGELADMIEDFSDGRIQFAFVKVRDPNSGLPKSVLVAWCGEGVPERTKGYFTSHLNAVSKVLHGYHVQVTARSDRDLTPEVIVQKVADSSGSKYSGSGNVAAAGGPPPPVASKPVLPTKSFGGSGGFQPLGGRSRASATPGNTDSDGWGEDAPAVTRSQLEKVDSAYKPTRVNMSELQSQKEPSRYQALSHDSNGGDVVRGGYQPIGKVDIAALRREAQQGGSSRDDRPTLVQGAYQPVGKVDINEIRKKAQGAPAPIAAPPPSTEDEQRPKTLAERSSAFNTSERLTSLPKPKVENRFGSNTSSFAGTKAPTPGGFEGKTPAPAPPVGTASRTFADQGGKTPAQIWAERKARERGASGGADTQPTTGVGAPAEPIASQTSGSWQSGYAGKKWGVQVPSRTGGSGVSEQKTGQDEPAQEDNEEPSAGGIGNIRDRFNDSAPMGAPREQAVGAPEPPPLDTASKPNAGARGVPIPGLPTRPRPDADVPAEQHQDLPPPPPRPQPADEPDEAEADSPQDEGSPVRIAMPVARGPEPEPMERFSPDAAPPFPMRSLAKAADDAEPEPEPQIQDEDPARGAAQAAAEATFGNDADYRAGGAESGGREAIAQYEYEKAEENELELREGERIVNIDMVDDDWWMGENTRGQRGLFPSNYVELLPEDQSGDVAPDTARSEPPPAPVPAAEPAPPAGPAGGSQAGATAIAQYEYEAAEDNELSFPEGAKITNVVCLCLQYARSSF